MTQFFTRPWDSQPQEAAGPSELLQAVGAVDLLWSAASPHFSAGKAAKVYGNGFPGVAGPYGKTFAFDGTGDSLEFSGAYSGTGVDYTLAAIIKPAATGVSRTVVSVGSGAVASGLYLMHSSAFGTWCLSKPGGAGDISSGVAFTTDWWFISASYKHSTGLIQFCLKNLSTGAVYTPTATNSSSWVAGDGNTSVGGARFYTSNMFSGPIAFAMGVRGELPLGLLREISENPWRLFEPQRLYIPTAAGGAGAQTLTPSLYSDSQSFFAPTVSVGVVSLAPSLLTNAQTFYAPTVSQGAQVLTPALLTNTSSFYAPSVAVGAVALSPSLLTNTQSFYAPVVSQGGQVLAPDLYANSSSFYAPTVTVGAVALSPGLFTNGQTFFVPYVSDGSAAPFVKYFDVLSGRLLILRAL